MQLRSKMEALIKEMLDGQILLSEAVSEFEKLYILAALARNGDHLCNTSAALGIHRNTLSKRVAEYNSAPKAKGKKREQPAHSKVLRASKNGRNSRASKGTKAAAKKAAG